MCSSGAGASLERIAVVWGQMRSGCYGSRGCFQPRLEEIKVLVTGTGYTTAAASSETSLLGIHLLRRSGELLLRLLHLRRTVGLLGHHLLRLRVGEGGFGGQYGGKQERKGSAE